ncbi:MAG: type VI secretion system baseplate subunit TssG, partial [Geobacteraceae bacterium]|nr:type VI secretion system baseplate subunit TssG [Geobacteraceae bacterium]
MAQSGDMITVMNDVLERGREFSFVQVLRLVRGHLAAGGEEGLPPVPWQDRVRVRPELSLAFPASDVARVERDGDGFLVTATFLSLYGTASPLPNFYTEELLEEAANDESVLRGFLDLINNRSYHLYFRCWSKYRLFIRIVEENNLVDWERLFCFIGLGEKELSSAVPEAPALLRHIGILTQYPRSAAGLGTILRDVLLLRNIRIIQNVPRMVPIPRDQRMAMGVNACGLGVDTVLGCEIADRMGKLIIEIYSLAWEELNSFLPGTHRHEKLSRYTKFYLVDPLDVELKLVLAAGEARPIRIGDPKARLGLNMWCFAGESIDDASAVYQLAPRPFNPSPPEPGAGQPSEERGFTDYYRRELDCLRKQAAGFAREHPSLAPRISGQAADPGLERLLEGTAFLNALLQRKLDDDFPEFIHEV